MSWWRELVPAASTGRAAPQREVGDICWVYVASGCGDVGFPRNRQILCHYSLAKGRGAWLSLRRRENPLCPSFSLASAERAGGMTGSSVRYLYIWQNKAPKPPFAFGKKLPAWFSAQANYWSLSYVWQTR